MDDDDAHFAAERAETSRRPMEEDRAEDVVGCYLDAAQRAEWDRAEEEIDAMMRRRMDEDRAEDAMSGYLNAAQRAEFDRMEELIAETERRRMAEDLAADAERERVRAEQRAELKSLEERLAANQRRLLEEDLEEMRRMNEANGGEDRAVTSEEDDEEEEGWQGFDDERFLYNDDEEEEEEEWQGFGDVDEEFHYNDGEEEEEYPPPPPYSSDSWHRRHPSWSATRSLGERSVPYSPTRRRSTLSEGRYSPTQPGNAMPGQSSPVFRSPSASDLSPRYYGLPGWASPPFRLPSDLSQRYYGLPGWSSLSFRSPSLSNLSQRSSRLRGRFPSFSPHARPPSLYSPTRSPGTRPVPYSPRQPRSGSAEILNAAVDHGMGSERRPRRHAPRLVQRSPNHWSISGASSASSNSGPARQAVPAQGRQSRSPSSGPYVSARSRSASQTSSARQAAELQALRAENEGLRLHNEELQQRVQDLMEFIGGADEGQDEEDDDEDEGEVQDEDGDEEPLAHGALPNDEEEAEQESSHASRSSRYESARTYLSGTPSAASARRSQQASPREATSQEVAPVVRRSGRISERNAKRAREATESEAQDSPENESDEPAPKRRQGGSRGRGRGKGKWQGKRDRQGKGTGKC